MASKGIRQGVTPRTSKVATEQLFEFPVIGWVVVEVFEHASFALAMAVYLVAVVARDVTRSWVRLMCLIAFGEEH